MPEYKVVKCWSMYAKRYAVINHLQDVQSQHTTRKEAKVEAERLNRNKKEG